MLQISPQAVSSRLTKDNPWWEAGAAYRSEYGTAVRRDYFSAFFKIASDLGIRRAAVLLGPRRVGKTVILWQLIDELLTQGKDPKKILYASIDAPIYAGIPLENYLNYLLELNKENPEGPYYIIFDEIQYLRDWEIHLKDLVDRRPDVKFMASGSAAAALNLQSKESGAGRFSDFMLPPLTFLEFIKFLRREDCFQAADDVLFTADFATLNGLFVDYLNFGGFPELAVNAKMRTQMDQFIRNDIIDKVLLKDLPNLYGIQNIQELNRLFSFLALNSGQEASLEAISQNSGLSKPAITNYIEYLKTAFLISTLPKLPSTSKGILRQRNFKAYLTNPSMRAALFGEVAADDSSTIGHLAEAAVLSQWDHLSRNHNHFYYRDKHGNETDVVTVKPGSFTPVHGSEIKWSDNISGDEVRGPLAFAKKYELKQISITSRTKVKTVNYDDIKVSILPTSIYCLNVGALTSKAAIDMLMNRLA